MYSIHNEWYSMLIINKILFTSSRVGVPTALLLENVKLIFWLFKNWRGCLQLTMENLLSQFTNSPWEMSIFTLFGRRDDRRYVITRRRERRTAWLIVAAQTLFVLVPPPSNSIQMLMLNKTHSCWDDAICSNSAGPSYRGRLGATWWLWL